MGLDAGRLIPGRSRGFRLVPWEPGSVVPQSIARRRGWAVILLNEQPRRNELAGCVANDQGRTRLGIDQGDAYFPWRPGSRGIRRNVGDDVPQPKILHDVVVHGGNPESGVWRIGTSAGDFRERFQALLGGAPVNVRKRSLCSVYGSFPTQQLTQADGIDRSPRVLGKLQDVFVVVLTERVNPSRNDDERFAPGQGLGLLQGFAQSVVQVGLRKAWRRQAVEGSVQTIMPVAEVGERVQFRVIFEDRDLVVAPEDFEKPASNLRNFRPKDFVQFVIASAELHQQRNSHGGVFGFGGYILLKGAVFVNGKVLASNVRYKVPVRTLDHKLERHSAARRGELDL